MKNKLTVDEQIKDLKKKGVRYSLKYIDIIEKLSII